MLESSDDEDGPPGPIHKSPQTGRRTGGRPGGRGTRERLEVKVAKEREVIEEKESQAARRESGEGDRERREKEGGGVKS